MTQLDMAYDGITVERAEPGLAVVVLKGEQEAYDSPRLEGLLASLLKEGAAIVVDLSRATFVDSTTLLVLLRARDEAERRGLGYTLQLDESAGGYVYRIFAITRLTSVFTILRTRAEAVGAARSFRPAPGAEPA